MKKYVAYSPDEILIFLDDPKDKIVYSILDTDWPNKKSAAFKRGVRMINSVAVIDSDFYNNETNEGEISLGLLSHNDDVVHIKKGECVAQGVFHKFLITDDDDAGGERIGGIGSTGI